uniref:Tr-type G domain-containing protein n=1 Tax=Acrobeloides nanus TaxID=290746 RepID=A0A914BX31_9BILA
MNIGILGHVDSGKTTLAKALSSIGSTAAFDKHAKSANLRANTIDLGFSALTINDTRIALIDCPGHASLIRAVMAASSVFDAAIVIINVLRGIEPQTVEHLLLVSILVPHACVIVLNKCDLISPDKVEAIRKKIPKALKSLKISENSPIVTTSLMEKPDESISSIVDAVRQIIYKPNRISSGHFVMAVDHCFPIKGKGTVMTGTVVDGSCKAGMEIEIPVLQEKRKVREVQSWKQVVPEGRMGDRVALLLNDVSSQEIDRTIIFEVGAQVQKACYMLVSVKRIELYRHEVPHRSKLFISIGFETMTAECHFLKSEGDEFELHDQLNDETTHILLILEHPVYTKLDSLFLAARLDSQFKTECRFICYGRIVKLVSQLDDVKRFHQKFRTGIVERVENENSLICHSLFKKETNFEVYNNMLVHLSTGESGRVEGSFGKSGKARIVIPSGILPSTLDAIKSGGPVEVQLRLKKYLMSKTHLSSY